METVRPDAVFHLAAQTFVASSWKNPEATLVNNSRMQLNVFHAIHRLGLAASCRVLVSLSSEEYGLVHPHELPVTEENPLRPLSPYAVSKVTQDMLAYQYFKSYGIQAIRMRSFNHTGPRRGEVFVTGSFARQIAEAELGLRKPVIEVGDLTPSRDWTDVRDVVKAYWLGIQHCDPGEVYVIASGKAYTIQEVLDILIGHARVPLQVAVCPERLRPSDVPVLLGESRKFREKTGWQPEIPFEQTLLDLLNYWRNWLAVHASCASGDTALIR
jgi:GDP-4-dehydro-6-deoxy-D-mannose reductase